MTELLVNTAMGLFTVALHQERAPTTCAYFANLARNGELNQSSIFRILSTSNQEEHDPCPIHIVQVGRSQLYGSDRHTIEHESTLQTGISHTRWVVSAARFDLSVLYGSFFICMRDEPSLDYGGARQADGQGFAAFGEVTVGRDVVEAIFNRAEGSDLLQNGIAVPTIGLRELKAGSR
ncbi:MAG TPA: peptidylprolyl isomerase [Xanthomonadales bacterium]|nr:peptidylprolyl isomerase [Xanthomonadales bacterium]